MTIELDSSEGGADRQVTAIVDFLHAVGAAQALEVHEGASFARSEGDATSRRGTSLTFDAAAARARRGRVGLSWIAARLLELIEGPATVRPTVVRLVGLGAAHGVTRPDYHGYALPGGRYTDVPGPTSEVDVFVATHRRRRDHSVVARSSLDIGRTLVHELVSHAWRDVSFYQPSPRGGRPAALGEQAVHRAAPHVGGRGREHHNLADAEADLIDHYWDLAMDIREPDSHASRVAREAGGPLGTRILRWQARTQGRRREHRRLVRERIRFLEERVRFAEAARRAQRQDRDAR